MEKAACCEESIRQIQAFNSNGKFDSQGDSLDQTGALLRFFQCSACRQKWQQSEPLEHLGEPGSAASSVWVKLED